MEWMTCPCGNRPRGMKPDRRMRTVSAARAISLIDASRHALTGVRGGVAELAGQADMAAVSSMHVTASGDVLASSSATAGNNGDVILHGTIGAFPCALQVHFKLVGALATLELLVTQPFVLGPITWRFELLGLVIDTAANIVTASSVAAAVDSSSTESRAMLREGQIGAWRFLNRVGDLVFPTLTECLPSLIGGPDAYVACVVSRIAAHDIARMAEHLLGDDLTDSGRVV
jgi:hypothetical protein